MAESRWSRVGALFEDTLALPARDRTAFLAEVCGKDDALRAEVESLLAAHAGAHGAFLKQEQVARLMQWGDVGESQPPKQVGPWRVIGEIGRGGMGVVYEARRADGQFEQAAALKLVKRGMDSDQYLERFLRERQILARMDHAGIARLLDGGVTKEGRPWFALERIDGVHLTQHCTEQKIGVEERLRLFNEVCSAVEYAHRNLIVHRDLKPSNVLVDQDGNVKLLDFGIAKILGSNGDGLGTQTAGTSRFGTPAYGAPELLRGGAVTTATDVFSLGVMLGELLSGKRPDLSRQSVGGLERSESRPSTGPDSTESHTDEQGSRSLDRDLANIIAKATQEETERRYVSAEALREDIERFLRGEPVRACPDSLAYRAGKFLRRHRTPVLAAGVAVLSLVVGLGTALWQAGVAARERDIAREESEQAEQVKKFMVDLFRASAPEDLEGAELTAKNLLDRGLGRVRSDQENRPDLRVELLNAIGEVASSLGDYQGARALFEEAASIDLGPDARNQLRLAGAVNGMGTASSYLGEFELAEKHHRRALALRSEHGEADSLELAETLNNLGVVLANQRKLEEAIERYERSLEIQERTVGPNAPGTLQTLGNLGVAYRMGGDLLGAERLLGRAVDQMNLLDLHRDPNMVSFLNHFGSVKARLGDVLAAERLKRQSFELSRAYWGESHSDTRIAMASYAIILHVLGKQDEAVPLLSKVLAGDVEQYGWEHPFVVMDRNNLASVLLEAGRIDDALAEFEEVAALYEMQTDPGGQAIHEVRYAAARLAAGQHEAARELADRGLESERQNTPPRNERLTIALLAAASARAALGLSVEAEALFDEALVLIAQRANPNHPDSGVAHYGLGTLYLDQGRITEACAALQRAASVWAAALPDGHWHRAEARVALGACKIRDGDAEGGRPLLDHGLNQLRQDRGEKHWRTLAAIDRSEAWLGGV